MFIRTAILDIQLRYKSGQLYNNLYLQFCCLYHDIPRGSGTLIFSVISNRNCLLLEKNVILYLNLQKPMYASYLNQCHFAKIGQSMAKNKVSFLNLSKLLYRLSTQELKFGGTYWKKKLAIYRFLRW